MNQRETSEVAEFVLGRRDNSLSAVSEQDPRALELILASAGPEEVLRLLEVSDGFSGCDGALTARLIELGGRISKEGVDDGQAYAEAMRLQQRRLEQNPAARRDLAMHPRTYGRPSRQLTTDADAWVFPMVEAEVERLSARDLDSLRHQFIMRIGRQHDIHPDFRPLLLRFATDDRTLACLVSIEQGQFGADDADKSYLLAAVAGPFIDVVMSDADDGIELEAAAWDFVQRHLAAAGASSSSRRLIQAIREASSLLALIDTSRALAARRCQSQTHAGMATRSAIAEFILSNLVLLATKPEAALASGRLRIGAFVRRDLVGRSPVAIPKSVLEPWATLRSGRRLLLDLVLVTLLADYRRHDLPPIPPATSPISEGDLTSQALSHLADIERRTLGQMAAHAINSGWHLGDWAGAA